MTQGICKSAGAVMIGLLALMAPRSALGGTDSAHYRTRHILLGYPPIALNETARQGAPRPGHFADPVQGIRMTLVKYGTLTDVQADQIARWAAERGFTQVLTEQNRYLFHRPGEPDVHLSGGSYGETLDEMIANGKRLADACHRYGIQLILHVTCTMVTKDFLAHHPQWADLDLRTGKQIATGYGPMAACVADLDFQAEYLRRLEKYIQGTGADGLMADEVAFWKYSDGGSAACRARFTKETGLTLPQRPGSAFFALNNPVYQRWRKWRTEVVVGFDQKITDLIHKYHGVRFNYRSALSLIRYQYQRTGYYLTDQIDHADVLGYECEPPGFRDSGYLYSWPVVLTEMKMLRAMSAHLQSAPWVLFYPKGVGDYTWNWLEAHSQGLRLWWRSADEAMDPAWRPLMNWERNHEPLLEETHPVADIGVLLSLDSALRNPDSGSNQWLYGFTSTCGALTDSHLPYRVLLDRDMTPQRLKALGIQTLFLLNAGSLRDSEVEAIRQFVRSGGRLVASGDTSLYDGDGQRRKDFALADVFGVSYIGPIEGKTNRLEWSADQTLWPGRAAMAPNQPFNQVKVSGATLLGWMIEGEGEGKKYPGVVAHRYGEGQCLYFAGHPESKYFLTSYHHKIVSGRSFTDTRDDAFRRLLARAARYGESTPVMIAENFPKGVVIEARRHSSGVEGIQVHLTNFMGGQIQSGTVPITPDITFPDVAAHRPDPARPMTLAVRMKSPPAHVYVISPDFGQTVELPVTMRDGMARVTIPNLYRYEIVCFIHQGAEVLARMNGGQVVPAQPWPAAIPLRYKDQPPLAGAYDPDVPIAFADTDAISGGQLQIPINGQSARVIHAANTSHPAVSASLKLSTLPPRAALLVGGLDDNASSKAPIRITINGREIFQGPSPFDDRVWSVHAFAIPPGMLVEGANQVKIENTAPNGRDRFPPWLAIHFVKIARGK